MLKWMFGSLKTQLFESTTALEKAYPYIRQKPWLMPYARLHRVFTRGTKAFRNFVVEDKNALGKSEEDRVRMFRDLGMM